MTSGFIPHPRFLVPVLILVAVIVGAVCWIYLDGEEDAEAGLEVFRWGNVTVQIERDSGVVAVPEFAPAEIKPPDGGQVLLLVKGESRLAIDAETGEILQDSRQEADEQAIEHVLSTLTIDSGPPASNAWPYGGDPPNTPREAWGKITFLLPDRASGITVNLQIGDSTEGGTNAIQLTNGRSTLSINADTGEIFKETTNIAPEDQEAFDRFYSMIEFTDTAQ
jgi:hypothetical protein